MADTQHADKTARAPTPRTDKLRKSVVSERVHPAWVQHAEQLERELAAMTSDRDMWLKDDVKQNAALCRALATRSHGATHTDHPARHWDRTCPACLAEPAGDDPVRDLAAANTPPSSIAPNTAIQRLERVKEQLALAGQVNRHVLYDEIKAVIAELSTRASAIGTSINEHNTYWGFVFGDGSIWTDNLFPSKEAAERFLKRPADAQFVEGATLAELVINKATDGGHGNG